MALGLVVLFSCLAASARASGDEASESGTAPPIAIVHLIGQAGESADLAALLRELLGHKQIAADVISEPRFEPDQLTDPAALHTLIAFVVMDDANRARLYFRAPSGERFLLRELPLPSGLDALGREAVGQVVESSVEILVRSTTTGMDRTQIREELARERGEPTELSPPPMRSDVPPWRADLRPRPHPSVRHDRWRLWLALRYAGAWSGPQLGPVHGPGAELGFMRAVPSGGSNRLSFGPTAIVERTFPQELRASTLDAQIDAIGTRLLVGLDWRQGALHSLSARAGAGADFVRARPTVARDPSVTPAAGSSKVLPVARVEVGDAIGDRLWRVGVTLFVDVALERTDYELQTPSGSLVLAAPWAARPGIALAFGFNPSF
jgi:hypothetical protein